MIRFLSIMVLLTAALPTAMSQFCGVPSEQAQQLETSGIEAQYQEQIQQLHANRGSRDEILTVPVVIYLVHPDGTPPGVAEVPSTSAIQNGLDVLNTVWNGGTHCGVDLSDANPQVQFCLAQRDIRGEATSGIEVISSSTYASLDQCTEEEGLKILPRQSTDRFPTTDYLNIYLVEEICASCSPYDCEIGGFSSYSSVHGKTEDGIVLEYRTWPGVGDDCRLTTTLHHELGHYFNLLHTFRGGCTNDDCLADGDKVCDTRPDNYRSVYADNPCTRGEPINSCTTDAIAPNPENPFTSDGPDLPDNLMDYAPPECLKSFTPGQVDRMRWTLEQTRGSLLESKGCEAPCDPMITLAADNVPETVTYGTSFTIVNASTPGYSTKWFVDDQTFTTKDLQYTPNQYGHLQAGLTSPDMSTGCRDTLWYAIEVVCGFEGQIQGPNGPVDVGQTLQWSLSEAPSGSSIRWYVQDSLVAMGDELQWTVNLEGQTSIHAEVCNDGCCEIVDRIWIATQECPTGEEGTHWIFGNDDPVHIVFENGMINNPDIDTDFFGYEAVVTQSDRFGNLQFYSDGQIVYNKNHVPMETSWGYDELENGSPSTTQMVSIPWPGRDSMYYLFYTRNFFSSNPERDSSTVFRAAIVDMKRNGGLGKVLTDTIKLFKPSTEKINAVRHCNGRDWWVLTTRAGTHELRAYLVDKSGLNRTPVISYLEVKQKFGSGKIAELGISPSGFYLFNLNRRSPDSTPTGLHQTILEIGTFDCLTGKYNSVDNILVDNLGAYSVVFSENERYLYYSAHSGDFGLYQIPIEHINRWGTIRDKDIFHYNELERLGGMEVGPNGTIYFIRATFGDGLGSVEFPDRPQQAAQIIPNPHRLPLPFGGITLNLPTFPSGTHHPEQPYIRGPRMYCDTASQVTFTAGPLCVPVDYNWTVKGASRILSANSDSIVLAPSYKTDTLIYTQTTGCATLSDTMVIRPTDCLDHCAIDFQWTNKDTVVCEGEEVFLSYSSNAVFEYVYPSARGLPQLQIEAGNITGPAPPPDTTWTYYLHLEMQLGCDTLVPFTITTEEPPKLIGFEADSLRCPKDSIRIDYRTEHAPHRFLINQQSGHTRSIPSDGIKLPPAQGDSCYTLLFFSADSSCVIDTNFCSRVDTLHNAPIDSARVCPGDSIQWRQMWLDTAGLYRDTIGCDSVFSLQLSVYPDIPPTIVRDTSCQYETMQIDSTVLDSEHGCDSLVITHQFPAPDITVHQTEMSCDSALLGLDTTLIEHPARCDTVLITEYEYSGTLTTSLTQDTCSPVAVPDDTVRLTSAMGCDSVVITSYNNVVPDTTLAEEDACMPQSPDTTVYQNQFGCDSVVITSYTVRASDTVLVEEMTCVPQDNDTTILQNQFGCDSIVITAYNIRPQDTVLVQQQSCMSQTTDTSIYQDQFGCDSVVITQYQLVASDTTYQDSTVCSERTSDTLYLTNAAGCDSVVIRTYSTTEHFLSVPSVIEAIRGTAVSVPIDFNFSPDSAWWSPSEDVLSAPLGDSVRIQAKETRLYKLTLVDSFGCRYTDAVQVVVNDPSQSVYIPNTFTPNEDGINDYFRPYFGDIKPEQYQINIYDRWGNRVFSCVGTNCRWNGRFRGREVQAGVYIYQMSIKFPDETVRKRGDVTVLR